MGLNHDIDSKGCGCKIPADRRLEMEGGSNCRKRDLEKASDETDPAMRITMWSGRQNQLSYETAPTTETLYSREYPEQRQKLLDDVLATNPYNYSPNLSHLSADCALPGVFVAHPDVLLGESTYQYQGLSTTDNFVPFMCLPGHETPESLNQLHDSRWPSQQSVSRVNGHPILACTDHLVDETPASTQQIQGGVLNPIQFVNYEHSFSPVITLNHSSLSGSQHRQCSMPSSSSSSSLTSLSLFGEAHQTSGISILNTSRRRSLPLTLYMPCDEDSLSTYQCLARQQIELFEADSSDVESNAQGRNRAISLGQVGIRRRHCAFLVPKSRCRGATYYPAKLLGLYQAAQNMAGGHLSRLCPHVPDHIRNELLIAREQKSSAGGGKRYWSDSARALGIIECENGLAFSPN